MKRYLALIFVILLLLFSSCEESFTQGGSEYNQSEEISAGMTDYDSSDKDSSFVGDSSTTGVGEDDKPDDSTIDDTPDDSTNDKRDDKPDNPPVEEDRALAYSYYPIITEEMPKVSINTSDGSNYWATGYTAANKRDIKYTSATVSVENCDENFKFLNAKAEVKVRGNATLNYVKKAIRIKFDKKEKKNMLGLNGGKVFRNWVLLADWKDFSMTNNALAFYLGNTILGSDGYYCTDFRNVEVYLNGQYWGVYLLVEQQEIADGRTSVTKIEDDKYTGNDIGYFFEYDAYYGDELNSPNGDPTFTMNYGNGVGRVNGYTIKSDIAADSQVTFLKNYMNNLYKIVYEAVKNGKYYAFNKDKTDIVATDAFKSAKEVVSSVIDVQSLIDTYLFNELVCNLDVDWSSFYLSLDLSAKGSGKLIFEAPWDFDSAFGVRFDLDKYTNGKLWAANRGNPWFKLVASEDWFLKMVTEKWAELKKYGVLDKALRLVEEQKNAYKDEYARNLARWPERQDDIGEVKAELNAYTEQWQAADYLKRWLTDRISFLDEEWTLLPTYGKYKLEAENAMLGGGINSSAIRKGKAYASGGAYVGDLSGGGRTVTFTVTAESACTVYLYASLSRREYDGNFSDWFTLSLNGKNISVQNIVYPMTETYEEPWHTFVEFRIAKLNLINGQNTITFTSGTACTNFDYICLYSPLTLNA